MSTLHIPPSTPFFYFLKNPLNCCHLGSLFLLGSRVANAMYQHRVISSEMPTIARISVTSGRASACTLRSASGVVMGARNWKRSMGASLMVEAFEGSVIGMDEYVVSLAWADLARWWTGCKAMRCEAGRSSNAMTACCPKERMRMLRVFVVLKIHYQSGLGIEMPRRTCGWCRKRRQAVGTLARGREQQDF